LKTSPRTSKPYSLFVFGRDLRLGDHAGLVEAARSGDVVAALVLEPRTLAVLEKNRRRAAYYCAAVAALARDLEARGARLIVRRGESKRAILRLAKEAGASAVTWSARYDAAAQRAGSALQSALEEAGLRATQVHDAPSVHPDETAAARSNDGGRGYRALAPYLATWSTLPREPLVATVRFAQFAGDSDPLPSPEECGASPSTSSGQAPTEVSESSVLAAFDAYLAGPILGYRTARNVPADGPTSRLSEALSFGVVSARTILRRVDERKRDPFLLAEENVALDSFTKAIARRDFFLQLAWFFEESPDAALQPRMRTFPFARSHPALDAWREGRTGFPLVDAGMRQLRETGWMHPRVRSVAASFLCFDLGVDWRVGRDTFDRYLVEDDAALATGNWQWAAAVGADLAQFPRIYNPRKQARSFDPRGAYVRRWIPELAQVPDADLFDAVAPGRRPQLALSLFGDSAYPPPVLDHEKAARDFLARYANFVR
jgi:deoxyribodipyrimidine photo-lyase